MRQFWKQPKGVAGLLYGQPAVIFDAPKERVVTPKPETAAAVSVRAHNAALQFARDKKQAAKAARRRNAASKKEG